MYLVVVEDGDVAGGIGDGLVERETKVVRALVAVIADLLRAQRDANGQGSAVVVHTECGHTGRACRTGRLACGTTAVCTVWLPYGIA